VAHAQQQFESTVTADASITIVPSVCPDFYLLAGTYIGQPSVYCKPMT